MACPYLEEANGAYAICSTEGSFPVCDEKLTIFCKNPDGFKKCSTFKECIRMQNAPYINKFITFLIPILFYLNLLILLLILEIISKDNGIILILGGVGSIIFGNYMSSKA